MLAKPFHFLLGFLLAFVPTIYMVSRETSIKSNTQVLALEVATTIVPSSVPTTLASIDSIGEVLAPSPIPIIVPEETPTSGPTETPIKTATPTPSELPKEVTSPTPTPDVWPPPEYEPWFREYAGQYSIDQNTLERLANCESHFNPNATSGDYVGMFQFSLKTWQDYRMKLGLDANPDLRTSAEESIRTAAFVVQQKGTDPWPACLR